MTALLSTDPASVGARLNANHNRDEIRSPPAPSRWGADSWNSSAVAVNHRFHRRGVGGDHHQLTDTPRRQNATPLKLCRGAERYTILDACGGHSDGRSSQLESPDDRSADSIS